MLKISLWILGILATIAALLLGFVIGVLWQQAPAAKPTTTPTKTAVQETVTATISATLTQTPQKVYVNSPEGLRLRKGASLEAEIILVMPYGAEITIIREEDGWGYGRYQAKEGYFKKEFTSADNPLKNWQSYSNSSRKFSLKLPDTWRGYVTRESGSGVKDNPYKIEFALPLAATTPTEGEATVATVFEILIYTPSDWQTVKDSQIENKPSFLGQSTSWVYTYRTINSPVTLKDIEYAQALRDVDIIVDTFEYQE